MTFKVKDGLQVGSTLVVDANGKLTTGLSTARTIALSGDVTGSVSFDGTGNVTISTTMQSSSTSLDARYYTETEADSRFVNASGDSMTGPLTITGNGTYVGNYGYSTLVLQDASGYPGVNWRSGSSNWLNRMIAGGSELLWAYSSNASAQGTGTYTEIAKMNTDYLWHYSDMRSPIFYDSDNTAYYVDPASTSRMNIVHANTFLGEITDSGNGDANAPFRFESDYSGWVSLLANTPGAGNGWGTFWAGNDNPAYTYFGSTNPNEYVFVGAGAVKASIDLDNGQSYFGTSVRSPIFYDSDNTGYYVDPNSTSNLNTATIGTARITTLYATDFGLEDSGLDCYIHIGDDNPTWNGTAYGGIFQFYGDKAIASSLLYAGGLSLTSHLQADSSVRSPIFYDSNDTGYYVDPASTSRLNVANITTLQTYGNSNLGDGNGDTTWVNDILYVGASDSGDSHFYMGENSSSWYGDHWYWDSAYTLYRYSRYAGTDSLIHYHDTRDASRITYGRNIVFDNYGKGIVGTYSSTRYQGVFSMGDSYKLPADGSTTGTLYGLAWSHPNAGGVAANLNTHGLLAMENGTWLASLSGSVRARDDMRAPIFYDQNDTGYYVDPNSTGTSYRGRGEIFLGPNSSSQYLRLGGNGGATDHSTVSTSNGNLHIDAKSGNNLYLAWYNSSDVMVGGGMQATIYYDRNNTGYYCDPASTSNFNQVNAKGKSLLEVGGIGSATTGTWYTIAVNSGNRASARFSLTDYTSGCHQSVDFYATHHYGNYSGINVISQGYYSTTPFRYLRIVEGGTYDGAMLQVYMDTTSSGPNSWMMDNFQSSGWVLLGTWVPHGTNPGTVANFAALTNVAAQVDLDTTGVGGMVMTGNIYAGGNVTAYSDRRLKTNITKIDNALEKLSKINGYTFDRVDRHMERQAGVIAQEVVEVLPEVVGGEGTDDSPYAVSYGNMSALLIEAIKEQQTQIEELKAMVAALLNK